MYSVLIVEDEIITGMSLKMELQRSSYSNVEVATSELEAIELFQRMQPDVILMDINLEDGGNGIQAANAINSIRRVPIIFVTAYASDSVIKDAGTIFPYGYIVKPYDIREIRAMIETAMIRFKHDQQLAKSETKLRVAVEAAQIGVMEINRYKNYVLLDGTDELKKRLKFSGIMPLNDFFELISEEDRRNIKPILHSAQLMKQTVRMRTSDHNAPRYFEVFLSDSVFDEGETIVGAVRDVTEQELYLHEMEMSDYIFNNMQESVLLLDNNLKILKINPATLLATGYSEHELLNVFFMTLITSNRHDDPSSIESIIHGREISVKRKNGIYFPALIAVRPVERSGFFVNYVVILTDITEIKKTTSQLEEIAYTDELTRLYNRSFMNKILTNHKEYFKDGKFAVFFIDLDLFKLINDTYGHSAGDFVLKEFSERLKSIFRSTDYIIRHGGDEFVILIEGAHSESTIMKLSENVHDALKHRFKVETDFITLTCSIGVAISEHSDDAEVLLKHADIAMYEAKNSGRNSHRIYNENYGEHVRYQLFLEQGLRQAIDQEKLQVWFQPVVNALSSIVGYEALCRWYDESKNFISPAEFIPLAEKSWLILPLGLFVFRKSCEFASKIKNNSKERIKINVNLSTKQLGSMSLQSSFQQILFDYGLTAEQFTLEITENVLQSPESKKTLHQLREMGFTIALDDFGTGYSNMAMLKEFPLDIIKIDKSLIQGRFINEEQRIVCDSVIDMCQKLGFRIVVEGIETKLQADYFSSFNDILQQGYFHGKPQYDTDELLKLH